MEFQKIVNLLDKASDDRDLPRFLTKKWIAAYDQSEGNYNVNKKVRTKTQCYEQIYIILAMIYCGEKEDYCYNTK